MRLTSEPLRNGSLEPPCNTQNRSSNSKSQKSTRKQRSTLKTEQLSKTPIKPRWQPGFNDSRITIKQNKTNLKRQEKHFTRAAAACYVRGREDPEGATVANRNLIE